MSQTTQYSRSNKDQENGFFSALNHLYERVIHGADPRTEEEKMLDSIRTAHADWKNAEEYFQNVTDEDLIDYAIYRVQAAKTRYIYLMKLAREMGVRDNFY
ncbi:MAG: YaaL family protein [Thermotaleaceae bacterium]